MGEHEFNKRAKSKELKPVSEIVVVPVPPLIDRETFDAAQALLKARHATMTPSAVISGPTGELNRRAAESEARLKRLYDAIEVGVADLDDPALKDRIDGLKAIRNQAKADAERAQAMLDNSGSKAIAPQMVRTFAETARRHIRLEGGGYRRDHLRALAQRVEVADGEVRIMGSKSRLLQVLTGKNGVNSVPTQGLKWRRGWDSNPRYPRRHNGFRDRPNRPLWHLSMRVAAPYRGALEPSATACRAD